MLYKGRSRWEIPQVYKDVGICETLAESDRMTAAPLCLLVQRLVALARSSESQ